MNTVPVRVRTMVTLISRRRWGKRAFNREPREIPSSLMCFVFEERPACYAGRQVRVHFTVLHKLNLPPLRSVGTNKKLRYVGAKTTTVFEHISAFRCSLRYDRVLEMWKYKFQFPWRFYRYFFVRRLSFFAPNCVQWFRVAFRLSFKSFIFLHFFLSHGWILFLTLFTCANNDNISFGKMSRTQRDTHVDCIAMHVTSHWSVRCRPRNEEMVNSRFRYAFERTQITCKHPRH